MDWPDAHRIAMVAASYAHSDYKVDTTQRIDIFSVIESAGLVLGFEPFPRLSGAYFAEPGAQPGVVVNANHPPSRQRYTAAHELGHHVLKHGTSVDPEIDSLLRWGGKNLPDIEKVAESFAAWFLMPRALVLKSLANLGIERPTTAAQVYTLSLRLGTSFEATARHLANLRLAHSVLVEQWLRVRPRDIKVQLARGVPLDDVYGDVWALAERDHGQGFLIHPGDRLILALPEIPSSGFTWRVENTMSGCAVVHESYERARDNLWSNAGRAARQGEIVAETVERVFAVQISRESVDETGALKFVKGQPWDPGAISATYSVRLAIEAQRLGVNEQALALTAA